MPAATMDCCLVYNYYSGVSNPLSCTTPSQGTTNNGNVVGYRYQDNVNPPSFSHTASYTYDGVNRLSTATAKTMAGSTIWSQTYGSQSYSHPDQWGNWTCSGSGVCPSLTWNSQNNQLLTIGNYSFSYDAAGNMTQDPSNYPLQPVHTYQWDAEGRVASVDGGSTWSFTYNALGHRVQWASPSGGELHLFDPEGNWLGNANSYTLVRFGERALVISTGSETDFNHINNIGSTTMWTNHTGSPVEDMLFYPWGDVWQGSGGYNFAYLPYRDLSTTTDITTARFISPNFGRWLSPDPAGQDAADPSDPQTWNMYAYVRNNPTTLTDPTGLGPAVAGQANCTQGNQGNLHCTVIAPAPVDEFPKAAMAAGVLALTQEELGPAAWIVGGGLVVVGVCYQAHCGQSLINLFSGTNNAPPSPAASSSSVSNTASPNPQWGEKKGGAQDKKLTKGEIQKLKDHNINPEELKQDIFGKAAGKTDLYKTQDGDIVVKGKGGVGPGELTGININNLD